MTAGFGYPPGMTPPDGFGVWQHGSADLVPEADFEQHPDMPREIPTGNHYREPQVKSQPASQRETYEATQASNPPAQPPTHPQAAVRVRRGLIERMFGGKEIGSDFDTAQQGDEHVQPVGNEITIESLARENEWLNRGAGVQSVVTFPAGQESRRTALGRGGRRLRRRNAQTEGIDSDLSQELAGQEGGRARQVAHRAGDVGRAAVGRTTPVVKKGGRTWAALLAEYATRDDTVIVQERTGATSLFGRLGTFAEVQATRFAYGSQYVAATVLTPPAILDLIIPGKDSLPAWNSWTDLPIIVGALITAGQVTYTHRSNQMGAVNESQGSEAPSSIE